MARICHLHDPIARDGERFSSRHPIIHYINGIRHDNKIPRHFIHTS